MKTVLDDWEDETTVWYGWQGTISKPHRAVFFDYLPQLPPPKWTQGPTKTTVGHLRGLLATEKEYNGRDRSLFDLLDEKDPWFLRKEEPTDEPANPTSIYDLLDVAVDKKLGRTTVTVPQPSEPPKDTKEEEPTEEGIQEVERGESSPGRILVPQGETPA
jgi:hypothetical protein